MHDDDTLLTPSEMAALRKVPPGRLNKERHYGGGPPFIKDGHLVRYRLGDYRSWLAKKARFCKTGVIVGRS